MDKPDYSIMNSVAHVVLPVAHWTGSVISWPIRAIGKGISNIKELSSIRSENEELRAKLDEALAQKYSCDIAIKENKKLEKELDVVKTSPYKTIVADIFSITNPFYHNIFSINKGSKEGVEKGMAVVSFDNRLIGIIMDVGDRFSRVRSLTDTDSNIAVRISGSDVYGFLQGNGKNNSSLVFLSDPKFKTSKDLQLITSNISGVLPSGIYVGNTINETNVKVLKPQEVSRVLILKFNNQGSYK
ncbi:MAG: rod shape-determining protein MreC [Alphaproteobacteria bacterium]|nr:rod shape-determining protein MreC [Alphaproteobacteria bacterium]